MSGHFHLLLVGIHETGINGNFGRSKGGSSNQLQVGVTSQLAGQPDEGLLKVVIALGTDVVVLEILLAMESDALGLDLAFLKPRNIRINITRECIYLDVNFVTAEDNGNVVADTDEVAMPVGNILVGDARGHIEHDDTALTINVVAVTETTKLFLSSSIPDVKLDGTAVSVEEQGMDFNTDGS